MKDINKLKEFKHIFGNKTPFVSITTVTEPEMNKGGRVDKVTGLYPNPMFTKDGCRALKMTESSVILNGSYESLVNNRLKKVGEETTFKTGEFQYEWYEGYENFLSHHKTDPSRSYLRVYYNISNNRPKVTYYVDSRLATEEEIAIIKQWTPVKAESKKQAESGLEEEDQVIVRDYSLSSIAKIDCGEYHFSMV